MPSTIEGSIKSGGVANLTFRDTLDIVTFDMNKNKMAVLAPWK